MSWLGEQKLNYIHEKMLDSTWRGTCGICCKSIEANDPFILCNQGDVICGIIDGCASGLEITNKFYPRDGDNHILAMYDEDDTPLPLKNIVIKGEECPLCCPNLMTTALAKVFDEGINHFQKLLTDRIHTHIYHHKRKDELETMRFNEEFTRFDAARAKLKTVVTNLKEAESKLYATRKCTSQSKYQNDMEVKELEAKVKELEAKRDKLNAIESRREFEENQRKRKLEYVSPVSKKK